MPTDRIPTLRHVRGLVSAPLLGLLLVGALLLGQGRIGDRGAPARLALAGGTPVTILAWYDLPKADPRSAELSGVAWDDASRTLYAITDDQPQIIPLRPGADFRTWSFGDPIAVEIREMWDGEGIALTESGFFISNEFGSAVFALNRTGRTEAIVPAPDHFQRILRRGAMSE